MRLSIRLSIEGTLDGVDCAVGGLRQLKAANELVFDLGLVRCSTSSTLFSIVCFGVVIVDVVDHTNT
jgi:hypothetical protein